MKLPQPKACFADQLWELARQPGAVEEIHRSLGDACHEARNQLNVLGVGLHLAGRSEGGEKFAALSGSYRRLERLVEQFHSLCRPIRLAAIPVPLDLVIEGCLDRWRKLFADRGRRLEVSPPTDPSVATIDPMQLIAALERFASWRASASEGKGPVHCRWFEADGGTRFIWDEPGTVGFGSEFEIESLSEAMLARLTTSHGGESTLVRHPAYRLELRWPSGP